MSNNSIQSKNSRLIVGFLSVFIILVGFLSILLSRSIIDPFWQDLMFALGLGLAPTGVIGLISDYLVFGKTIDSLDESNESLGLQVEALRISTDFLKQSSNLGLEMIYPDRESALKDFAPLMREQAQIKGRKGKLLIVGSSIKGLREVVLDFDNIIKSAIENEDCELGILLTHPKYSRFRENQEERPPGAIEDEIFDSIRLLEQIWDQCPEHARNQKPTYQTIKLYKGTPTCFMIIVGDKMLINPYPYEKEAYRSFCLSVRTVDHSTNEIEVEKSIFQQYYTSHFEFPWKRNALPYRYYLLKGPIPDQAWDKRKSYGDIFVIQDSGEFYLAVYLTGDKEAVIRGIPTSIPYAKEDGGITKTLNLGNRFTVQLLRTATEPSVVEWAKLEEYVRLDNIRRTGKFSGEVPGHLINEYEMVGLFEEDNPSPYKHAFFAERDALRETPLPLFYHWLDEERETPPPQKEHHQIDHSNPVVEQHTS